MLSPNAGDGGDGGQGPEGRQGKLKQANKPSRAHAALSDAFTRHRDKSQKGTVDLLRRGALDIPGDGIARPMHSSIGDHPGLPVQNSALSQAERRPLDRKAAANPHCCA